MTKQGSESITGGEAGEIAADSGLFDRAAVLDATPDFVGGATPDGRVLFLNRAARRMIGIPEDEDVSRLRISDFHPPWATERIRRDAIPHAIREGSWLGETALATRQGKELPVSQVILAHRSSRGEVLFLSTIARDMTDGRAARRRLAAQDAATRALAQSGSLEEALPAILEGICGELDWDFGAYWKTEPERNRLVCGAVWRRPDGGLREFEAVTRASAFEQGVGLPGRVLASGKPAWIVDVARDPNFPRGPVAERSGIHGAFAFPVLLENEILGVLEFFAREVLQPDPDLLDRMGSVGSQLGQFARRKRAELAIRESEARKSAVIESALDCIVTIDEQGRIVEFNPAAEATFGYAKKDVLGRQMADLIIPTSMRGDHRKGIGRHLSTGTSHILGKRLELTAMRADGSEFPVELTVTRVGAAGPPLFTGYLRDITERKRAERDLRRSKTLLESLSKAQARFIADANPKAVFEGLLDELLALTESAYGFIGEVFLDADGAPYLKTYAITDIAWDDESRRFFEKHSPAGLEFRNLETLFGAAIKTRRPVISNAPASDPRRGGLPPGHPALDSFLGLPIRLGEELLGMVGIANRAGGYDQELVDFLQPFLSACGNVIQAHRSEQKRREAEREVAKLSLVASRADNAVVITDRDGLVEWVNDGFVRLTGYQLSELLGRKPGEVLQGPLTDPATVEEISRALRARATFASEILNYRKDGRPYWVSLHITPILGESGEVEKFIAIQNDISERKRDQEELRRAKEAAEAANLAKSQFLAVMSHEIRTPLNAIIGMSELALETHLAPDQVEYLQAVQSNSEALLNVINDILDFSKIEAGQMDIQPEPFDPREIVEGVAELLSVRASAKGLELYCDADPGLPAKVMGDANRLRQILLNLVGNAVKFTDRGEVRLSALHAQAPESEGAAERIVFTVSDTGVGIPEEALPRVFERFYQADASNSRRKGGSGLGLSITKLLVERMGGGISLESQAGVGTTVTVRLPFPVLERRRPCGICEALRGREVLVVDDSPTGRSVLTRLLRSLGLRVEEAVGGREVLALLAARPEDERAILLDLSLPDMEAIELARRIVADPGLTRSRLVLMSAFGPGGAVPLREFSSVEQLAKPIRLERLIAALARAFGVSPPEISGIGGASSASERSGKRSARLLLVEDSRDSRLFALKVLTSAGHRVDTSEHGRGALEAVRKARFDLILMDVQMPDMDGFQATAQIRRWEAENDLRRTPIVALTAHAMEGYRERCLAAGMDDYLSKPLKKEALLRRVAKWVPGKTSPSDGSDAGEFETASAVFGRRDEILVRVDPDILDLVPEYLASRRRDAGRIRELLVAKRFDEIRVLAHNMRGSGSGYGFSEITRIGGVIEEAAANGDPARVSEWAQRLDSYLSSLRVQPRSG